MKASPPNQRTPFFFYSISRHIINAKNSIFFYFISRLIVNFYNLPVTLNDSIKCNNQILLIALFFFRSWTYRPLFSMNHNSPLTLKSLLVSLLLGVLFCCWCFSILFVFMFFFFILQLSAKRDTTHLQNQWASLFFLRQSRSQQKRDWRKTPRSGSTCAY